MSGAKVSGRTNAHGLIGGDSFILAEQGIFGAAASAGHFSLDEGMNLDHEAPSS
jgi:hypothetical protein